MTHNKSYWREKTDIPEFDSLRYDTESDIVIIGGGITGIVTGYMLAKKGRQVTILEADSLYSGTTGYTTAKLTAQHGLIYDEYIQHFNMDTAKTHYEACMDAISFVKETTSAHDIDCNLTKQDAYIYTKEKQNVKKLETEYKAYQKLGIQGELSDTIPLPYEVKKALIMKEQYQYHPLKFLNGLLQVFLENGGKVYTETPVDTIEEGENPIVVTKSGLKVTCKKVVVASHFPFYDGQGFYFARLYQDRSYVVAAKPKNTYPGGMYINADTPTRSVRSIQTEEHGTLLLIGGESHRTGEGYPEETYYKELTDFAAYLDTETPIYMWSAQDTVTLDNLPYIGYISKGKDNIFVATGFRKWGMTSGIVAGLEITSLIDSGISRYKNIYQPSRFHADPDLGSVTKNVMEVAKEFVIGKLEQPYEYIPHLKRGEATKVRFNGLLLGVYKDKSGEIHQVDTTCTHMKCEVNWNSAESSWDCPCHGSRFTGTGEVIEGPAKKPLKKLDRGLNG
ncbi:Glycine/D-amino acid oxidase [Terribacillus halophilus]|uniref:Glycine/D-amino acid oxidase n=1 Tax=Terribacillus halophilus TaxID=361279 RepID=A0A1G6VE90_9BACI|nr:FAD-dependent oxidoreductase [Terribacillus halophilus]SDD51136.1 Glycine/D-amino acid oxidase [Terribacillus halophilus]